MELESFLFFLLGGVGGNDEMGRQREMVLRKFLETDYSLQVVENGVVL